MAEPDETGTQARRSRRKDLALATLVVTLVVAADQLSKAWARANLPLNRRVSVIDGWFGFGLTKNSGATFSLLRGQNGLLELVIAALMLLMVIVLVRGMAPDRLSLVGLAAILGGTSSNALDRLRLSGVTDFLLLRPWPADFNLVDVAIRAVQLVSLVRSSSGGGVKGRDAAAHCTMYG